MSATETWDGEWVKNPPPKGKWEWPQRLAPLRERPGEWARFGPFAAFSTGHQVGYIRDGKYGPGFQAYRRLEEHQDWIYVSYSEEET